MPTESVEALSLLAEIAPNVANQRRMRALQYEESSHTLLSNLTPLGSVHFPMQGPSATASICVVGSINMDMIVRAPTLPRPGETILGGPIDSQPGGKGANQAVAAARMGAEVTMLARIGEDDHGRAVRGALAGAGVDVTHVLPTPDAQTGLAMITVGETGENAIVVVPGANALLTPADVESRRDAIAGVDVLVMQLEVPIETVRRAAEIAREAGVAVLLNAAPAMRLPVELLSCVDVLVVNEHEGAALTGAPTPRTTDEEAEMIAGLTTLGVETVVLTVGSRGSWFARRQSQGKLADPFKVRPVDTVGAGDAFVGALATRMAQQRAAEAHDDLGLMDAVCWANAAGALACLRPGAQSALPTRSDVVAFLRQAGHVDSNE